MAGPAAAIALFILFGYLCFMTVALILGIRDAIRDKKIKLPGIIFFVMASFLWIFYSNFLDDDDQSSKFLGDYKLKMLDGKKCDSCLVMIKKYHIYEIWVKNNVVGQGKWRMANFLEKDIELPYPTLKLEHGPDIKSPDTSKVIDYIDLR
jgi:hypothetical protein